MAGVIFLRVNEGLGNKIFGSDYRNCNDLVAEVTELSITSSNGPGILKIYNIKNESNLVTQALAQEGQGLRPVH